MVTPLSAAQGAVQGRDDAGGQGPVQAEGIADGEHLLAHLEVVAGAQGHRRRPLEAHADAQHGDVVGGRGAHQGRPVVAAIGQLHRGFAGVLDDVVIGDDVARVVPDEAGTGAARHGEHVAGPEVAHLGFGGDEHHGTPGALEQLDGGLLVGGQVAPGGHDAGRRFLGREPALDVGQATPEQDEQDAGQGQPEQAGEEAVLHDGSLNAVWRVCRE
jgi:hypothetical protein